MPPRPAPFEILSGIHCVTEALRAGRRKIFEIYTAKPLPEAIAAAAGAKGIPVVQKSKEALEKLAGSAQHQQVAARVAPFELSDFRGMLQKQADPAFPPFFLILDSIMDPGNLGALVRTAVCAGISGIIVPRDRSAPLTPAVSRASAGAMEHCAICRVTNLAAAIRELKKSGIWITGLDRKGHLSVYDADMTGACAIVVGGEHTGIRRLVAESCDNLCHIPQIGPVNSLNASAAGAIAIYEAFRQRSGGRQ